MSELVNLKDPIDVIVVGAGNAALCAAISAHEHGAKVAILEAVSIDGLASSLSYLPITGAFVPNCLATWSCENPFCFLICCNLFPKLISAVNTCKNVV